MKTNPTESPLRHGAAHAREMNKNPMLKPTDVRRYPRLPYTGRVTCADVDCEIASLDLSPAGVGLLSTQEFSVGQEVTLVFLRGSVKVRGVVRRIRPTPSSEWNVGIAFLQDERELIDVVRAVS